MVRAHDLKTNARHQRVSTQPHHSPEEQIMTSTPTVVLVHGAFAQVSAPNAAAFNGVVQLRTEVGGL